MAFPFPKLADGSVLYGKGVPQLIWAGVPSDGSIAIAANTVGSGILVMAEFGFAAPPGAPASGIGYLTVGSPVAGTAPVRSWYAYGDGNYDTDSFVLNYFTSGLDLTKTNWVLMTGSFNGITYPYLTILGF